MVGWVGGGRWAGGCARHRQALICALPLISLLVLIWIATCGREWIHSCTQSTTSVIGCSVEWQPPYVPEQLCRGYNNKPCERWQIKTTGIKVHHIITWFSGKLPSPPPPSLSIFVFFPILMHFIFVLVLPLSLLFFLVHPNKHTFSSCQPS